MQVIRLIKIKSIDSRREVYSRCYFLTHFYSFSMFMASEDIILEDFKEYTPGIGIPGVLLLSRILYRYGRQICQIHKYPWCCGIPVCVCCEIYPFLWHELPHRWSCVQDTAILQANNRIKGTISRDGFGFWWNVWLVFCLNRGRGHFLIGVPMISYREKYSFCVIKSLEHLKNLKTGPVPYLGLELTMHVIKINQCRK